MHTTFQQQAPEKNEEFVAVAVWVGMDHHLTWGGREMLADVANMGPQPGKLQNPKTLKRSEAWRPCDSGLRRWRRSLPGRSTHPLLRFRIEGDQVKVLQQ